jgi:hypothetical protein
MSLGVWRTVARIAVVAGAMGSVGLLLRAGRDTPRFLLVLFVGWILAPFLALAWAHTLSPRWPVLPRATLYGMTLVVTLASWAIYGGAILRPSGSSGGFYFVLVPAASCVLTAIAISIAALISRSRRAP